MDLRAHKLTEARLKRAALVFDYQPFFITDELQTGAAYSWVTGDIHRVPQLRFKKAEWQNEWIEISEANEGLRLLYDGFLDEIAARFPKASLFDMACNNGYFPVGAELRGMRGFGSDFGKGYFRSIRFLNQLLGTKARFINAPYKPYERKIATMRKFDVVVASAIMCHLPNPLDFLAALSAVARQAIFFWGYIDPAAGLMVSYQKPSPMLQHQPLPFPYIFNDNTSITRELFDLSMHELGFREIIRLEEAKGALKLGGHQGLLAIR